MACRIASGSCRSAWFAVARWSAGPTSSLHGHTFCAAAPETPVKYALIQGSSRGIGLQIVTQLLERPEYRVIATCRNPAGASELQALQSQHAPGRLAIHQMDVTKPEEIRECAEQVKASTPYLSLLFNVAAVLHIPGKMSPETALSRITAENINTSFQTNAIGPILVCQAFEGLLAAAAEKGGATEDAPAVVANMSARVASITDNEIGGWYSYRASKTALNQLTKTLSLEFKRRRRRVACVLLHPGTCDTDISAPFKKNVPPEQLFTAERGARQLIGLVDGVSMRTTGSYIAWDGQPIQW